MAIEPGYNTDQPIRERGWMYWHQLFTPRDLIILKTLHEHVKSAELLPGFYGLLGFYSKLSRWIIRFPGVGGTDFTSNVFLNQALNTLFNWANRSLVDHTLKQRYKHFPFSSSGSHAARGN
jgi:putative DNA methylase